MKVGDWFQVKEGQKEGIRLLIVKLDFDGDLVGYEIYRLQNNKYVSTDRMSNGINSFKRWLTNGTLTPIVVKKLPKNFTGEMFGGNI